MTESVPVIYSPRIPAVRISVIERGVALMVTLVCLSVLILAGILKPNPAGLGTHTGPPLDLDSCAFLQSTGLPCPTCGMTTSFAWFVRGNFMASFYIQPMGTVLAVLTVIAFWTGLYIVVTGRPTHRLVLLVPGKYYLYPLLGFALAAWAWKIFIYKHGIDGWR